MDLPREAPFYLLDHLKSKKPDFFDVRFQHTIRTQIQIIDKEINQLSYDDVSGAGIRVLHNGVWGFSSTNSFNKAELLKKSEEAYKIVKNVRKRSTKFLELKAIVDKKIAKPKINPMNIDIETKTSNIFDLVNLMKDVDSKIKSTQVRYSDSIDETAIFNSEGSEVVMSQPSIEISFNILASNNAQTYSTRGRESSAEGYEFLKDPKINNTAVETGKRAIDLLDADKSPSGRNTVVLDPSVAGLFIHEAFGHSAEADTNLQGRSFLLGKLNEIVASPMVTVFSDGTYPKSTASYAYDSEAVPSNKIKVIDQGIFKTFMHSRETASYFGVQPTSNGRAEDYSKPPIVRMNNLYFAPGDSEFEEIIEETANGVLLRAGGGGLEDPEKGRYQFTIQNCYKIVDGQLKKPMRGTSVSGWTIETLLSVDMLGKHLELDAGSCGKGEPMMQITPVLNGGPYVRMKNVLLGG